MPQMFPMNWILILSTMIIMNFLLMMNFWYTIQNISSLASAPGHSFFKKTYSSQPNKW